MSCAFARVPCRLARLASPSPVSSFSTRTRNTTLARRFPTTQYAGSTLLYSSNAAAAPKNNKYDEKARKLDQKGLDKEEQEVRVKMNQTKRPWLRENADKPPAEQTLEHPSPQGKKNQPQTP